MADDDVIELDPEKLAELEAKARETGGDPLPKVDDGGTETVQRTTEESVDELKARLGKAEADRIAAEGRATAAEHSAREAKGQVREIANQTVDDTIAMVEAEIPDLKSRWIAAKQAGDFEAEIELFDQLQVKRSSLERLKDRKEAMVRAPAPPAGPAATGDVMEDRARLMEQGGFSESAKWLRAHPDWARDQTKSDMLLSAHNIAIRKGLHDPMPEYFAFVERTLGIGSDDDSRVHRRTEANGADHEAGETMSDASRPTGGRQAPPAAAPVSREARGNGGQRPNSRRVTLTKEEAEIAAANKQTPEEYYFAKQALIREGKLTTKH